MARAVVWDWPVRLVHWALVVLIPFSWWAHYDHLNWHRLSGYTIAALLVMRLWLGLAGGSTARFGGLVGGPARIRAYLAGEGGPVVGHNPLGGWSVAAMLGALAAQVGLGLFAVDADGLESGPLARFVSFETGRAAAEAHEVVFFVLLGLIALHLAAVGVYAARGRNLVGPMLTGRATLPDGAEAPAPAKAASVIAGLALAGAVLALLLWLSKAAGLS